MIADHCGCLSYHEMAVFDMIENQSVKRRGRSTDQSVHRQRNPQTSIYGSKYILVTSSGDGRS